MSKAEILAELSRLSAPDRHEILEQLCLLEEAAGPTLEEMHLLNEAQAEYDANPTAGDSWENVEQRIRARK